MLWMRKISLILLAALAAALLAVAVSGCNAASAGSGDGTQDTYTETQDGGETETGTETGSDPGTSDGQEDQTQTEPGAISPLTGLAVDESIASTRPIAIMINNLKSALPQYGISLGDIYYEVLTEGSITRIMMITQDWASLPDTGTVRSARDYFLRYAAGYDAVFAHFGGSPQAYSLIKSLGYDNLDGLHGGLEGIAFWRDKNLIKTKGYEHSVLTNGEKLLAGMEKKKYRSTIGQISGGFVFNQERLVPDSGVKAEKVTVPYSGYITAVFEYDEESGSYLRSQFGAAHIDAGNGSQIAVENVLIVFTECKAIAGDEAGRISVAVEGSGKAILVTAGKALNVSWSKKSVSTALSVVDDNGADVPLNPGKTWVCVVPLGCDIDVE